MQYRLLGRSGLRVSALSLGTMTFGDDWGWGAPRDDARAMFDAYAAAGGNFIDTASNYTNGTAEQLVGEFVAADRDAWVIATKYTLRRPGSQPDDLNAGGNSRKNMTRTVEASLRRLNTDYIDLLYLHMWDYSTPIEEVMRGLDDLVRAGKVLYLGISDSPAWVVSRAQTLAEWRGYAPLVAYQAEYNLVERGLETDVAPMCAALGLALPVFNLLGGGALTGKFSAPGGPGEPTRRRSADPSETAAADALAQMATEIGRSPAQIAINWAASRNPGVIPILGARRPPQLAENLAALDFTLDETQMATLNALRPPARPYPHSFWNEYIRRDLIYGRRVDDLNVPEWPQVE